MPGFMKLDEGHPHQWRAFIDQDDLFAWMDHCEKFTESRLDRCYLRFRRAHELSEHAFVEKLIIDHRKLGRYHQSINRRGEDMQGRGLLQKKCCVLLDSC